jgi:hypothetical protein
VRQRPAGGRHPGVVAAVAVGIGVVVLLALWSIGRPDDDVPLSPRSDGRLGTSALVALARELGAEVTVGDRLPGLQDGGGGPDVILLFADLLSDEQRADLTSWVEGGGRLVVTDPASQLTPLTDADFDEVEDLGPPGTVEGRCEIDALDGIDVAGVEPRRGGVLYRPPGDADGCIGDGFGSYIVARDQGDGTIVAIGGNGLVVNVAIAEGENAPVVSALVAPERGTELLVLEPGPVGGSGGQRDLLDLIGAGVKRAFWQLVVAFVAFALWRARRLGRPVPEPQPVAVAGSELVAAVGNLLDRTRSSDHAAELLRADLRRFLADHLGLPADTPAPVLATVAAERTGVDPHALAWAVGPQPVTGDADLVALAHTIDRIREEVLAHV